MRLQIRTLQVPLCGAGAFTPTMTFGAAPMSNGQNIVTGSPGTIRVSSPRPAAMNDGSFGGRYNQPSSVAPDWFLPSIYTGHENPSLRFPGKVRSDNPMPVPAINQGRSAAQFQHRPRIGGRTVTASVRPFTQWPTY
jgi:hypothetical protein